VVKKKLGTLFIALILLSFAFLRSQPMPSVNLAHATRMSNFPNSLITPLGGNTTVTTRISVCPSSLIIPPRGSITVAATVTNVTNLYCWQVAIEYNASVINCSALWIPPNDVFHGNGTGPLPIMNAPTADGLNCTFIGALIINEAVNASSGTLFDANFTGMENGETAIRIGTIVNPIWAPPGPTAENWYSFLLHPDMTEMPFIEDNGLATVGSVNVTVLPTNDLALTFANVTGAGSVTANKTSTVQAPPLTDLVGQYYDVRVTASYSGNVTVSLAYDDSNMTQERESSLRMMEYTPILGDVNLDGKVDMKDIGIICMAYGSYPGHPKWNANADINGDNKVDMRDIGTACLNYGKTSQWVDITAYVDTINNVIYGKTTHFSLIGIH
jgi:hypothetical protein